MKIDQMPDPREERELAESLHQALEPLQDAPPPSLAPEQIAAMLEAERIARDPRVKHYPDVEEALRELKR